MMTINQSACWQDDGDSLLNNNASKMAAALLFDVDVDDYDVGTDSGDNLLSSEEGSSRCCVFYYYL